MNVDAGLRSAGGGPAWEALEWCVTLASGPGPVLPLVALAVAGAAYAAGVRRIRRMGGDWPIGRSGAFVLGLLLLAVAALWAQLSDGGAAVVHAWQHVGWGMWAPVALVLGQPFLLLLRALPPPIARRIVGVLRARVMRIWLHPATVVIVNSVSLFAVFLTPLYAWAMASPLGHRLLELHFLTAGVLLAWVVIGDDASPHRHRLIVRLGALLGAAGAHAWLAKLLFAYGYPRGTGATLSELQQAAQIMYYGGDAAELALLVVVLAGWYRSRSPARVRCGRRAAIARRTGKRVTVLGTS